APHGHLAMIGMQKGTKAEINLAPLLARWLTIHGTGLRGRPPAEQAIIMGDVARRVWPLVTDGPARPVIHDRRPLGDAADARRLRGVRPAATPPLPAHPTPGAVAAPAPLSRCGCAGASNRRRHCRCTLTQVPCRHPYPSPHRHPYQGAEPNARYRSAVVTRI